MLSVACTDCCGFERCLMCDMPIDQDTVLGPFCYRCLTIKLIALEVKGGDEIGSRKKDDEHAQA